MIGSAGFEQFGTIADGRKDRLELSRAEQLEGMGIEGQSDRRAALFPRKAPRFGHQGSVTEMDAVKVADRQHTAAACCGRHLVPVQCLQRHLQRTQACVLSTEYSVHVGRWFADASPFAVPGTRYQVLSTNQNNSNLV